jgi:hypothetical protein
MSDFDTSEIASDAPDDNRYDFASGLLKSWWKKYHA